ncbi:MAG: hypothetical protein HY554_00810 [Elusimicrobia bacterium]|nr:hypothetical protein [Elusimicrobiota bacterium]
MSLAALFLLTLAPSHAGGQAALAPAFASLQGKAVDTSGNLKAAAARRVAVRAPERGSAKTPGYEHAILARIARHLPGGGSAGLRDAVKNGGDLSPYRREIEGALDRVPPREKRVLFLADQGESERPWRGLGRAAKLLGFELHFIYIDRSIPAPGLRGNAPVPMRIAAAPAEYLEAAGLSGGSVRVVFEPDLEQAFAGMADRLGL